MKIAVMGAGAVGCYYGGMLARAGHAVSLVGRATHVEAICRQGLLLETSAFQERVAIRASTEANAIRDAKLVLCCVKSADTEQAGRDMVPHLDPEAIVLSLQNGVDNGPRLAATLCRAVAPVVVYVATEMAGLGHVRHHGRGELVVGPAPLTPALVEVFTASGIPTQVSDNVVGELWAKLVLNCAYNALSAATRLPYGRLVQGEGVDALMRQIVAECLAVARADGVSVPGDTWEAVQRIARTMPGQCSSTAQDLARGKRTEIDHLNGYVLRRGAALGVATPANQVLHTIVKLLEGEHGAA